MRIYENKTINQINGYWRKIDEQKSFEYDFFKESFLNKYYILNEEIFLSKEGFSIFFLTTKNYN